VQVNAIATMLFIITSLAIILVFWQQRRAERMAQVQPDADPVVAPPVPAAPGAAGG
jgi:hypothetical protein